MRKLRYFIPENLKRLILKQQPFRYLLKRQLLSLDFPRSVAIMTSIMPCIYKCRMCPQRLNRPETEVSLSIEQFRAIIDSLPRKGFRLELSSYGETLLVDNLEQMIRYAKQQRPHIPVILVSNGLMLSEKIIDMIIAVKLDVLQVSLNAPERESFKWLMGVDGFDKATNNVRRLIARRKESGSTKPEVYTHVIDIKEFDQESVANFLSEWRNIVDRVDARPLGNWGGLINGQGCTRKWNMPKKRYPCAWLWSATKILPNGEVNKCFVHFLSGEPGLGNINEQNLKDIWQGEKLARVRQKHLEGRYHEEPLCGDCDIWALFPNVF